MQANEVLVSRLIDMAGAGKPPAKLKRMYETEIRFIKQQQVHIDSRIAALESKVNELKFTEEEK